MTILFTILHVIVSLFLILVVLAQQGKGQDLASAFGGGGSQTAFGARGTATLLSKITAGAAITFMVTSLTLSYLRPAVTSGTVVPDTAPAEAPAETPGEAPAPGAEAETPPPAAEEESSDEPAPDESEDAAEDDTPAAESEADEAGEPPPQ